MESNSEVEATAPRNPERSKSNGAELIILEGVTKVFFTEEVETHALSGIHLEIKKGEYLSIAGPSGCGKSTLLSILGLLDSPTGRQVHSERHGGGRPLAIAAHPDSQP